MTALAARGLRPSTTGKWSLGDSARAFFSHRNARILVPAVLAAWVIRFGLGGWTRSDGVVVVVMVGLQPFTEWLIHVFVLHFRPRRVAGRTIDLPVARKHRAHHRDPKDAELVFVPLADLLAILVIAPVGFLAFTSSTGAAFTGIATAYSLLSVYEWTHFLIHSPYPPRGRYFRSVRRAHWLHHYKNEQYWFGVTVNAADHVLRTFPVRDAVPTSPTARTLGVEN